MAFVLYGKEKARGLLFYLPTEFIFIQTCKTLNPGFFIGPRRADVAKLGQQARVLHHLLHLQHM